MQFSKLTIFIVGLLSGVVVTVLTGVVAQQQGNLNADVFGGTSTQPCDFNDEGVCGGDCPDLNQFCGPFAGVCGCMTPPSICGDGVVSESEECESDADCASGNGCAWCLCFADESLPSEHICGDDIVSGSEQCERDGDCAFGYDCAECLCYPEGTSPPSESICGDGVVSGEEQCESNTDCASGYECVWCMCYDLPDKPIDNVGCNPSDCSPPCSDGMFCGLFTDVCACIMLDDSGTDDSGMQ